MSKKLYVGGLPYSTTETELSNLFSKAGKIATATIIMDRDSGNSKGFGFVEMETDADATNAISMFDGQDFDGRTLVVNEARPKPSVPTEAGQAIVAEITAGQATGDAVRGGIKLLKATGDPGLSLTERIP